MSSMKEIMQHCSKLIEQYAAAPSIEKVDEIITIISGMHSLVYQTPLIIKLAEHSEQHQMSRKLIEKEVVQRRNGDHSSEFAEDRFFRKGFNPMLMVDTLVDEDNHYLGYTGTLYRYNGGVYGKNEVDFEREVRNQLRSRASIQYVRESRAAVLSAFYDDLSDSQHLINFKDCILDFGSEKLDTKQHSSDFKSIIQFPINYKSGIESVKNGSSEDSIRFVEEIVGSDNVLPIMEMIGAIFHSGSPRMQTAFILTGEGSNGKSTLLEIIQIMVGADNICKTGWAEFGEDKYSTHKLVGKPLSLDHDYNTKSEVSEVLKKVIEGETITVQEKYKPSFDVDLQATMICACNDLPITKDVSYGFFRRFHIINFPNKFKKDANKKREILSKLTAVEEMNAFAVLCILKYKEAWVRGYFTTPHGHQQNIQDFEESSNPVVSWISQCLVECEGNLMNRTDGYNSYKDWCESNGHKPLSATKFFRALRSKGIEVDREPARYNGYANNFRALHNYEITD